MTSVNRHWTSQPVNLRASQRHPTIHGLVDLGMETIHQCRRQNNYAGSSYNNNTKNMSSLPVGSESTAEILQQMLFTSRAQWQVVKRMFAPHFGPLSGQPLLHTHQMGRTHSGANSQRRIGHRNRPAIDSPASSLHTQMCEFILKINGTG